MLAQSKRMLSLENESHARPSDSDVPGVVPHVLYLNQAEEEKKHHGLASHPIPIQPHTFVKTEPGLVIPYNETTIANAAAVIEDPDSMPNRRKKKSKDQLKILEEQFKTNMLPDRQTRDYLGKILGLSSRQVQIWFQNKRAKHKRAKSCHTISSSFGNELPSSPSSPFLKHQPLDPEYQFKVPKLEYADKPYASSNSLPQFPLANNVTGFQAPPLSMPVPISTLPTSWSSPSLSSMSISPGLPPATSPTFSPEASPLSLRASPATEEPTPLDPLPPPLLGTTESSSLAWSLPDMMSPDFSLLEFDKPVCFNSMILTGNFQD